MSDTVCEASRVQRFDILLCKSAIRSLFFRSNSLAVFCILSRLFVSFGFYLGFRLISVRLAFHVHLLLLFRRGRGQPYQKETENQNPEATNEIKQVLPVREKLLCGAFAFKNKRPSKKPSSKNSLSVKICATVISSEGYDYENLNKVRRNDSKHPESV